MLPWLEPSMQQQQQQQHEYPTRDARRCFVRLLTLYCSDPLVLVSVAEVRGSGAGGAHRTLEERARTGQGGEGSGKGGREGNAGDDGGGGGGCGE